MDGLEKMVKLRGGFQEGQFPPIVRRMIGWYAQACIPFPYSL